MAHATLHLLVGPVGAGKTTYARRHVARSPAVHFDLDAWMVGLFGADPRPPAGVMAWYLERVDRCRRLVFETALSVLATGTDVVLELGLLGKIERIAFYERVRAEDVELAVYLLDAPRAVRRQRVAQRNRVAGPYTQIVPPEIFEQASDAWDPPDELERAAWDLIDI